MTPKTSTQLRNLFLFILLSFVTGSVFAQPLNNNCGATAAHTLTVNANCTPTFGTLDDAQPTAGMTNSSCGTNTNTRRDVWYRFQVPANSNFVTCNIVLRNPRNGYNTGDVSTELYSNTSCATNLTPVQGCSNLSVPKTWTNLTPGNFYNIRVSTLANTTNAGNWDFDICLTSNDTIANATTMVPGETYVGTVFGASAELPLALGCASGNPDDDVWYRFTAVASYATITMANIGANLVTSGARIQVYSGNIGSLVPVTGGCAIAGYVHIPSGLTANQQYYVRVYAGGTGQAGFSNGNVQFSIGVTPSAPVYSGSGRMKEIYRRTILSTPQLLADPWEITYGPDNKLWITEAKGYRLYKVDPVTGARDTVVDLSQNSAFQPDTFRVQFNNGNGAQGGFAGMVLHPKFLDPVAPVNHVYISYVYRQWSSNYFVTKLVRFTYNTGTGKLGSPVSMCDSIPGSNDHNSQRLIIVPVAGTHYLFYACGDQGAGQFANRLRAMKAQDSTSYEGKILRFNLITDGESGFDQWIPNDNPYNEPGVQSAVWAVGVRNNQGFAYDSVLDRLYGSSHGPYSDDEINIIERRKNYGHPLVIGYAADNNYAGITAGAAFQDNSGVSTCPVITNEVTAAAAIWNYKDPLFSAYGQTNSVLSTIWNTNPTPNNGGWPSEGWSGLDLYQYKLVPGWYKSLVAASLKWGRLVRIRLKPAGDSTRTIGTTDTASYFGGTNRFRDLAISNQGKDIYVVMERSTTSSGPSAAFPVVPACGGCVQKYSFVGYDDVAGKSSLPTEIDISAGVANTCAPGTTVTINSENSNHWVPITGPDGEIIAEIFANGQTLGEVTSSVYRNTNALRSKGFKRYLDRNITLNAEFPPLSPIKVRFYITKDEYDRLDADIYSQVNTLTDLRIFREPGACQAALVDATNQINPTYRDPWVLKGYVLQSDNITGFSTFYFAAQNLTLPLELLTFSGLYKNGASHLKWETSNENNTDHFIVERSIPNGNFEEIGKVNAKGSPSSKANYTFVDDKAASLGASFILYRLKLVDKNGDYTYSDVVSIQIPDILTSTVNLFPNPANNKTILAITSPRDQQITWNLIDNAGRIVLSNREQIRKGSNNVTIDLNKIPAGSYFLQVNGQFANNIQKLQKL